MLVAAVAIWGASYPVTRYVLRDIPPFTLAFLRYGLAGLLFALCMGGRLRVPRSETGTVLLLGVTGGAAFVTFMNLGMAFTTGISGALLSGAPPLITALLALAILREPLGGWTAAGLAAGIAGVACVAGSSLLPGGASYASLGGNILILASQCSWALYTVMAKRAAGRMPGAVAGAWTVIAATGLLFPFALAESVWGRPCALTGGALRAILYLAFINTALAYLFWNRALHFVGAATAAGFQFIQPLSGALVAMALLGEVPTLLLMAGAVLILAGVSLMARAGKRTGDTTDSSLRCA